METREETPCHSSWQSKRRWRRGEEEEPEKTEVEFQIQNERKHKSKEEEDENDRVAVGEELRSRGVFKEVKHNVEEEEDKHGDDVELILLYIVHSDISSLLHQILSLVLTVFSHMLGSKNACAAGGMAREEVGEELRVFSKDTKPFTDRITAEYIWYGRAPGEDTEVILYPQGNAVCLFLSGSVVLSLSKMIGSSLADAYTNEVYVLWHDLSSGRRLIRTALIQR
ncbi:hypothetical protein Bca101_008095 [Brassica carinata]